MTIIYQTETIIIIITVNSSSDIESPQNSNTPFNIVAVFCRVRPKFSNILLHASLQGLYHKVVLPQSAGAVEYTDWVSAER